MKNSETSSAHTPGPWKVREAIGGIYINARYKKVCTIIAGYTGHPVEIARKDASLIAAAPELLDYCKMLLDDVQAMAKDPEIGRGWDWSLTERNLKAIITKAHAKRA